jgi:hypothetical protein
MDRFPLLTGLVNSTLLLAIYIKACGVPSLGVAALEVALAAAAGVCTWWAVRRVALARAAQVEG